MSSIAPSGGGAWGEPPEDPAERTTAAAQHLTRVPRLTPLWAHIYVGDHDQSPVFSIIQADFPVGRVPFWSLLHAYSQMRHTRPFGDLAKGGL